MKLSPGDELRLRLNLPAWQGVGHVIGMTDREEIKLEMKHGQAVPTDVTVVRFSLSFEYSFSTFVLKLSCLFSVAVFCYVYVLLCLNKENVDYDVHKGFLFL